MTLRKSAARGRTKIDWLDSYHSFSFGHYRDFSHMGFGPLRVINEDIVAPGGGFPTHPHEDMEIITVVLEGALAHKDSLGNGSTITPGEVQRMSAGTGIHHSEFNFSKEMPVHLLQIWILPAQEGLPPSYEQKNFSTVRAAGKLTLLASPDGRSGSVTIHQDASLSVLDLADGGEHKIEPSPKRTYWLQVARGALTVNGTRLEAGDGLALLDETYIECKSSGTSETLFFDMIR